jgi:hypothetical protein
MHFIDRDGRIARVAASAIAHPFGVVPRVIGRIRNDRSGTGRSLRFGGERITLLSQSVAEPVLELVLVDLAFVNVR